MYTIKIQTQRVTEFRPAPIQTHYVGSQDGTLLDTQELLRLANEFWPFVHTTEEEKLWTEAIESGNVDALGEWHYINNGMRFLSLDLDDFGYNVRVAVDFEEIAS